MKKSYKLSVWNLIGLIVSCIFFFVGVGYAGEANTTDIYSVPDYAFGGDFYTEVYNGVRVSSLRLEDLRQTVNSGIGTLIMLISAVALCMFGKGLLTVKPENYENAEYRAEIIVDKTPDDPQT